MHTSQISQYQTDSSAQHLFWSLPPYRDHFSVLFITSSGLRTLTSSSIGLDFHTLLSSSWSASPTATNSKQLNDKLKSLARAITLWSKERVGNITLQLQTCRDFIGWTDRQVSIRSCSIMEKQVLALIKRRLTQLSVQEEERRKQRAHFKWKSEGDRNNFFFNAYATGRKLMDHIHSLLEHAADGLHCHALQPK